MSTENEVKPQGADSKEAAASELAKGVDVTGEDLMKSIQALEAFAKSGAGNKKQELLTKSMRGEATAEDEKALAEILSGGPSDLQKAVSAHIELSEDLVKSETVQKLQAGIAAALGELVKSQEKAEAKRSESFSALVETIVGTAKLVKAAGDLTSALNGRLDNWGKQPAREARGLATPVARELTAQTAQVPAQRSGVSEQQIMKSLMDLAMKAGDEGRSNSGQSYPEVVAQFQTSKEIHPAVLNQVIQHIKESAR